MTELLLLLLALVLIVLCGLFVAAEFALVTVDRRDVERAAADGDPAARGVLDALRTLSTQLSGAQVGITITNLAIGFLAEPALATLLTRPLGAVGITGGGARAVGVVLAMLISTTLTMVFGELVPKNLAIALPLRTARAVQAFMRGFTTVMRPLIGLLNGLANRFLRRIGIEPTEELASARSPQELSFLVARSADEGTLDESTATLVRRSLAFGERRADEVMTPRSRLDVAEPHETLTEIVERIRETGRSRFPVLNPVNGGVLGLVTVSQVLQVPASQRAGTTVEEVMVQPLLVPSSVDLDSLLATLRGGGHQVAVVIDEFGSVDGVVSTEDLVEELAGELEDEHDRPREPREVAGGQWELSGLLRIDEVRDMTGLELPTSPEYDTLAGLVLLELGRLAQAGDRVQVSGRGETGDERRVTLTVGELDDVRIDTVLVAVDDDPPAGHGDAPDGPDDDERRER